MSAFYGEDLTYIHDCEFGWYAEQATPGLLRLLRKSGIEEGLVVDLGCGSGYFAREAVIAGYQVLGIDGSEAMIRRATRNAPGAVFFVADLNKATVPPCAAVVSMGEVLSYVFAADKNNRALRRLFRRVYRALQPGGLFIFDVGSTGHELGGMPKRGHWSGPDWAVMVEAELSPDERLLSRYITSFRKHGKTYRRTEELHRLRLYQAETLQAELAETGFHSKRVKGFGRLRFRSGHIGFVARKP